MSQIFSNDIGTVIILDTETDLTGLTDQKILLKRPNGSIVAKTATVVDADPTKGKITFTSVTGDWLQVGVYSIQAKITFGSKIFYGTISNFTVLDTLP